MKFPSISKLNLQLPSCINDIFSKSNHCDPKVAMPEEPVAEWLERGVQLKTGTNDAP